MFEQYRNGSLVICTICLFVVLTILLKLVRRAKTRAPGPYGLPFLGYLPFVRLPLHYELTDLAKKYGDIFEIQLGTKTVIVFNYTLLVYEAFKVNPHIASRPAVATFEALNAIDPFGFTFNPGYTRKTRKAASRALAQFSTIGNQRLQGLSEQGLADLCSDIDQHLGQPWDPTDSLNSFVAGVIGAVVFGINYDPEHRFIKQVHEVLSAFSRYQGGNFVVNFLPFGYLMFNKTKARLAEELAPTMAIATVITLDKTANPDLNSESSDVIENSIRDFYPDGKSINPLKIRGIVNNLFAAGFGITYEHSHWLLNILSCHPDIQDKLHSEITATLGNRAPTLRDKPSLPYLEALIAEGLRFVTNAPLAVWHSASVDTTIKEYSVPKDSIVMANLWAINHNENVIQEPFKFKPDRFMKPDGSFNVSMAHNFIPFSTGRRKCPGENLGRQELFLIFSTLMQLYRLKPGCDDLDYAKPGEDAFTRGPTRYPLIFNRHN